MKSAWFMTNVMMRNRDLVVESSKDTPTASGQIVHEKDERVVRFEYGLMECDNETDLKFLTGHAYFKHPNPNFGFNRLSTKEEAFLAEQVAKGRSRDQLYALVKKYRDLHGDTNESPADRNAGAAARGA